MLIVEVVLGSFKTGGGYKLVFCMRNWNSCQVFEDRIKVYEVDCTCELYHNAAGEESRVFRACSCGVFAGPLGQCSFLTYLRWSPGRETHKLVRTWPETHRPRGIDVSKLCSRGGEHVECRLNCVHKLWKTFWIRRRCCGWLLINECSKANPLFNLSPIHSLWF